MLMTHRFLLAMFGVSIAFGVHGCGSELAKPKEEKLVPASGIVKVDGKPSKGVTLLFHPADEKKNLGGCWGQTDDDGKFTVTHPSNKPGIPFGTYYVTLSRFLKPDGTVPDKKEPFITSGATESIAEKWSAIAKVKQRNVTIIPDNGTSSLEFEIASIKKK